MTIFNPESVVRRLDDLGLALRCTVLPDGGLAFAPWHGAGGAEAQAVLMEACQSSAQRVALLAYLRDAGRVEPG